MRLGWATTGVGETGLDRGVLYLADGTGVPWNGLVSATETGEESVQADLYFDGTRFAYAQSGEDFGLTLEVWTYPPEFEPYDGLDDDILTKQRRKPFGFSYRTDHGEGHKIHLVWNAKATPADKPYSSRNNELEISLFQWQLITKPKTVVGIKPTAHFVIDTNLAPAEAVEALEDILYGTDLADPSLPEPQEVIDLFLDFAVLVVTDNGDGTATITGPDEAFDFYAPNKVRITWPSVVYKSDIRVQISSM